MWMGPPKALDWPNPISSISTMRTLGALAGALTSNRGGGVAFRASNTVLCGYWGSGSGSIVRSVGSTTRAGPPWAATGATVSGASVSARDRLRPKVIDIRVIALSSCVWAPAPPHGNLPNLSSLKKRVSKKSGPSARHQPERREPARPITLRPPSRLPAVGSFHHATHILG